MINERIFIVDYDNVPVATNVLSLLRETDKVYLFCNTASFLSLSHAFRIEELTVGTTVKPNALIGRVWTIVECNPTVKIYVLPPENQSVDMAISFFVGYLIASTESQIFIVSQDNHFQYVALCANSDGCEHVSLLNRLDYGRPISQIFYTNGCVVWKENQNGQPQVAVTDADKTKPGSLAEVSDKPKSDVASAGELVKPIAAAIAETPTDGAISIPVKADFTELLETIQKAVHRAHGRNYILMPHKETSSKKNKAKQNILKTLHGNYKTTVGKAHDTSVLDSIVEADIKLFSATHEQIDRNFIDRYINEMKTYVFPLCLQYVHEQDTENDLI